MQYASQVPETRAKASFWSHCVKFSSACLGYRFHITWFLTLTRFPMIIFFKNIHLRTSFCPPGGLKYYAHIICLCPDESSKWELILVTGFSLLGTIEIYQPVTMGTSNTQLLPCILNMVDLISLFVASPFWTARRWCALLRAAEVFACPARGSYPLLDLPQSQVVILDDWRSAVPYYGWKVRRYASIGHWTCTVAIWIFDRHNPLFSYVTGNRCLCRKGAGPRVSCWCSGPDWPFNVSSIESKIWRTSRHVHVASPCSYSLEGKM